MSINHYLADDLANKVIYLSKALNQAQNTITILKTQNQCLKEVLTKLESINNNDYEEICDIPANSGI